MNKTGVALGLALCATLCGVQSEAKDVNPMEQHKKNIRQQVEEEMRSREVMSGQRAEDARALGRELLLASGGLSEKIKKDIGELAVQDAQARVIENIPINKARAALSSAAGSYEDLKMRYGVRRKMLPAWSGELGKQREELSKIGGTTPKPPEGAAYAKAYDAAYRAREKVLLFYQGEHDPDQLSPYQKAADNASLAFYEEAYSHALSLAGGKAEGEAPAVKYAKTELLAMDDEIQVAIMGKRLENAKVTYEEAIRAYEKLYAKEISRCMNSGNGFLFVNGGIGAAAPTYQAPTYAAPAAAPSAPISSAGSGNVEAAPVSAGVVVPSTPFLVPASESDRDDVRRKLKDVMSSLSSDDWGRLAARRAEYANELSGLGYFDEESSMAQAASSAKPPTVPTETFRIDGEARLDYGAHHGYKAIGDRARARVRIYGDYRINEDWHFISMLENEKILSGPGKDNWMDIDRYYLSGKVGKSHVDAGAFGSFLAEGNVYDSKFTGVRVTGEEPFRYLLQAGTVNNAGFVAAAEAETEHGIYTLGAGLYRFDLNWAGRRNIYMLKLHRPWGAYDLGIMGLVGEDKSRSEKGYVISLTRGEEKSWEKGNKYYFLKYYHQPYTTYVSHTMEGMADYMSGFEGIGLGMQYTVAPDWLLQASYYNLKDLDDGGRNRTLWLALSYYFSNYQS